MVIDSTKFKQVIMITGYTDGRKGIDGLADMIKYVYNMDPFEKEVLYIFCGKNSRKIKGIVWEGDGFVLLTKRLDGKESRFHWPRNGEEARALTQQQLQWLMTGLRIDLKPTIKQIEQRMTL